MIKLQDPETYLFQDDGTFPNSDLPLVIYKQIFSDSPEPGKIEKHLKRNNWNGLWRNGIYSVHHYHSTAHEVLAVYRGEAEIIVGGPLGMQTTVRVGDVIIIPAGIAHMRLSCTHDFSLIGGYPDSQRPDTCYSDNSTRPAADERIKRVPMPTKDPIFGKTGPLIHIWHEINQEAV